jgi:hypothetical protein
MLIVIYVELLQSSEQIEILLDHHYQHTITDELGFKYSFIDFSVDAPAE